MRKILFLLVALAFLPALALAEATFAVDISQPSDVLAGSSTFFDVAVKNNANDDWFTISIYPQNWISVENGVGTLLIPFRGERTFRVFVNPPVDARGIPIQYSVSVENLEKEKVQKDVLVYVKQRFTSAMMSDLSLSCSDCSGEVEAKVSVKNVGNSNIESGRIIFTLENFRKEVQISKILPGEEKTFSTKFLVSGLKPKAYTATAELVGPELSDVKTAGFSVPEMKNVIIQKTEEKTLFGTTVTFNVKNYGNVKERVFVSSDKQATLTAFYPKEKPSAISGGILAWSEELAPGESREYSYSQVFLPIPGGILLVILFAIYGYFTLTAIEIKKLALGTAAEFGVSLKVRNRGRQAEGVVVKDIIPHDFSVLPKFETLKPIMRRVSEGTELIWRIGSINSGEEKVLHYRVKADGGGSALPAAVMKGSRGGSIFLKKSNFVVVPKLRTGGPRKIKVSVAE